MSNHNRGPVLRLGVVGLGRAFMSMLPSLIAHPLVRITAATDMRKDTLEKFAGDFEAKSYESMERLCGDPSVDAVYIATPHQFHADQVILAARHGKHAIVEKPMALSIEECEAMNREVEEAGVQLVVGHTHGFDPPILRMREIVQSGALGKLRMISSWNYTDFLYRPRRPEELDTQAGGGIIFNQVPHQIDIVRTISGGYIRSVRASTGVWNRDRPTEGSCMAFLDFEDGTTATIAYSGYGHFDSDELFGWVDELGRRKNPSGYGQARRALQSIKGPDEEAALKTSTSYGGVNPLQLVNSEEHTPKHHQHFGIVIASCDQGDIRQVPDGVAVYGNDRKYTIEVPPGRGGGGKAEVIDELYDAIYGKRTPLHDGRWGEATLRVCLAILESARKRQEVFLTY